MKFKIVVSVFCLAVFSFHAFANTYKHRFNELFTEGDVAGQENLLSEWEKVGEDDPEFYIAYFNYCVKNSREELIWTSDSPAGANSVKLTGTSEAIKDIVAYMNFETKYDKELLDKGFEVINKGIKKYPGRLDMRFGEIYMYGEVGDYDAFTSKITDTINYSDQINNKWVWTDGEALEKPEQYMLGAIQDYQIKLYNTQDDKLLENMKLIAETVLKYYPDNVESLSNLSLVYSILKEYDKALEMLSKAEELAPKDCVVLNNKAHIYKITGDDKNALKYYNMIVEYGDNEQKELALRQIAGFTKK